MRPSMKEMEKDTGKWDKAQLAKCLNLDVQKKGGKKKFLSTVKQNLLNPSTVQTLFKLPKII